MTPKLNSRVAKAHHGSDMCIIALAVLAGLASSVPAEAATYQFAVPSTLIQNALTNGVTFTTQNPNLFAFYEFNVRPMLPGELTAGQAVAGPGTGQILPSSTIVGFAPPSLAALHAYTANLSIVAPSDGTNPNARYTYASGDTFEALITPNGAVAGKSYEPGLTAELMPTNANFYITISSDSPLLTDVVRFDVHAVAYKFSTIDATPPAFTKGQGFTGFFDLQGAPVPEPGALFTMSAGLGLLVLIGARRRRAIPTNS